MPEEPDVPLAPSPDPAPDSEVVSDAPELSPSSLPFPIVGIGASAGGLEAYIELLKALPPDTGMAFVLVSHLAAERKSYLPEILSDHTAMPLREVRSGEAPEPNHVYLIPPNTRLSLTGGKFKLESRRAEDRIARPIDHFLQSLAGDQKNRAIGVLLSGADSDGSLGLRAIKGEGGITFVQIPDSARFPYMPLSGIAADHVDLILRPAQIASELGRIALQFRKPEVLPLEEGTPAHMEAENFGRVLAMLRGISGIEFRQYRPATLRRRLARRLMLKGCGTLTEYVRYLQKHREELGELQEDLLIGVTHFFRDPPVWDAVKQDLLPRLFEDRSPGQQFRIWVPGCSTGEETYTIAMSLLEYFGGGENEPSIQVFGTDASQRSIDKARRGIYPESIVAELSPERQRRFFAKVENGYQITKRIRDLCIFARQNLCSDPPFSKIDLLSCRNVLIYFTGELQKQILPTFHYALRENGFLLLGRSETVRNFDELFTLVDRRNKIYSRVGPAAMVAFRPYSHPAPADLPALTLSAHHAPPESWSEADLQRAADRIVLARYAPPGVVINEQMEILQSRGHTAPFLEMAPGSASLQLLRMLHDAIAVQVRDAIRRAIDLGLPVRVEGLELRNGTSALPFTLDVLPIMGLSSRSRSYLVLFVPAVQPGRVALEAPAEAIEPPLPDAVKQLRHDLAATKLYLQTLLEERDARNQELISANEEIQSANEELQSTNEELETTKEELQSANEELQTINEELQQRNLRLTQASNDLNNLLNSVSMAVLMLSNHLEIRHFTPAIQRLMKLRPEDVGRPVSDIRIHLNVDDLEPLFREVLDTLAPKELEVEDREGHWHLMRVRPYRTMENTIEGLVVVLIDIDQMRRIEQEVRKARDFAQSVIESIQIPLVILGSDLRISTANSAFRNISEMPVADIEGHFAPDLLRVLWGMGQIRGRLEELLASAETDRFEFDHQTHTPEPRWLRVEVRRIAVDTHPALLLTVEDVTARKSAEELFEQERQRFTGEAQTAAEALGRTQQELRALAGSLFTSQEEERRRIARELHDDVSQRLAVLLFDLENCERLLKEAPEEVHDRVRNIRESTSQLAEDVRRLSHGLHPAILDDLGLPAALKAMVDEFADREHMVATFSRRDLPHQIPRDVAAAFYRVAQQALRNVVQHAGRTHVKVTLEGAETGLRLEVADFGEGFDTDQPRTGLGLISMEERARLVNGAFHIESTLGKGTTVRVEVPLPPSEDSMEKQEQ